ncbi:MAG TPA: ZIP family metal transporter [Patescibacteria group bacterium]|nr:ZIP family metal transporter [Patescibacteria group bacterium]
MNTFAWIAVFAIGAAIVNTIGIFAVYKNKVWAEKTKTLLMCFAAGVLISTPLMLALPKAVEKNSYAGFAALAGFLFMFFSNAIIKKKTRQKSLAFGVTALEGIGIHSFVDGITYTITFSASLAVGFLAGIGMVLHEFAEGLITFSVLKKGGVKEKKAFIFAFLVAALTTPVGAFVAYPFVSSLSDPVLGLALGFVAGVLIYVSSAHLLPEAREHEKEHSVWGFLTGVALALLIVLVK